MAGKRQRAPLAGLEASRRRPVAGALYLAGVSVSETAALLGVSATTIYRDLAALGLRPDQADRAGESDVSRLVAAIRGRLQAGGDLSAVELARYLRLEIREEGVRSFGRLQDLTRD